MAKPKKKKRKPTPGGWQDRLSDLALRSFVVVLKLLPVRARLNLVGWTTRRVIAPLLGWYDRVYANIDHVWPDTPMSKKRKIAEDAVDNLGRAVIENYDPKEMLARGAAYPVTGPGLAALKQAQDEGRAVLLISAHYGNPVCGRNALVARGFTVAGIFRPLSNPFSNPRYLQNYRDVCEPVFVQGRRGTMGLMKHVREGGIAAILFDVYESSGEAIDFLGKPAPTALSPAEIALKTDALLVPSFGIRRPDRYGFDVIIEEPIPHGEPLDMMREATRRLEARIEDDPGQWMWTHRRWKPKRQERRQRKRAAAKIGP